MQWTVFFIIYNYQLIILGDARNYRVQSCAVCGQCLLFSAVAASGSKIFEVDYGNLHTNILIIKINSQHITAKEFCERLAMVRIQYRMGTYFILYF